MYLALDSFSTVTSGTVCAHNGSVTVTDYQVKQFDQIKEKEVIREIRNIWKRSKNKLRTESKASILFTSNSYMGTHTNEYPFSEYIIILIPSKRATQAFLSSRPDLVFQIKVGSHKPQQAELLKLKQLPYFDLTT